MTTIVALGLLSLARAEEVPPPPPSASALARFHHYQADLPLCGVFAELGVLESFTGVAYPIDEMIGWYVASGTFDLRSGGVPTSKVGEALAVKGIKVERRQVDTTKQLAAYLENARAVLAVVDPSFYWDPANPMLDFYADLKRREGRGSADHLVWITGMGGGFVYINDSALPSAPTRVRLLDFSKAWAASDFSAMISTSPSPVLDPDGDGKAFRDADGDGYASLASGGRDCSDGNAALHPGAKDIPNDGVDQDCSGHDAQADADRDGVTSLIMGGTDCDDEAAGVHPGASDAQGDRLDSDCDGSDCSAHDVLAYATADAIRQLGGCPALKSAAKRAHAGFETYGVTACLTASGSVSSVTLAVSGEYEGDTKVTRVSNCPTLQRTCEGARATVVCCEVSSDLRLTSCDPKFE